VEETSTRRVYRSRGDRVLGGVAGGLGEYLGIDPVLMRIAFVALGISGVGVVAYIVGLIAIPEAPIGYTPAPSSTDNGTSARFVVGVLLVAAGVFYMLDWVIPIRRALVPLTLIGVGAAIALYGMRK